MIIKEATLERIGSPTETVEMMKTIINGRPEEEQHREYFYSIGLNSQNKTIYVDLVTLGDINECRPNLREILSMALIKHASSLILYHNHPDKTNKASDEDVTFTKRCIGVAKEIGLNILDHIIIAGDKYTSLRVEGLI